MSCCARTARRTPAARCWQQRACASGRSRSPGLPGDDGRLEQIEFSHGPAERREALFVNSRRDQPNGLAAALGCELTAAGTIVTDADGRTNVAGVYAAGDAATAHSRSVANAIGTGSRVAYAVALERLAPVVAAAA